MAANDHGLGRTTAEPIRISRDELDGLLVTLKKNVASWCRRHDEFDGVAGLVLAESMATYDPDRGSLEARVAVRARSRMARTLYRHHRPSRGVGALNDGYDDACGVADHRDPFREFESRHDVQRFLQSLTGNERVVAALLTDGHSQAEAARLTGIHPRKVSRIVAALRPKVGEYFNDPLATAVA